jgi:hypothetical protein
MKRKLTFLAATTFMAFTLIFQTSANTATSTVQSCQGQCQRAFQGCMSSAKSNGEQGRCNQAYQGCVASCKSD